MTIIFFGSDPWFSPPVLEALINAGHKVPLVVTKGDTIAAYSQQLTANSFILNATDAESISKKSLQIAMSHKQSAVSNDYPDAIVLAAFGPPFLGEDVLNWPKYGCLNVHASLLPRWRGASPISSAIAAGDPETGITIMKMTREIDRGPILAQAKLEISQPNFNEKGWHRAGSPGAPTGSDRSDSQSEDIVPGRSATTGPQCFDTRESLTKNLGLLGGKLLVETIKKIEIDQIKYNSQPLKSPTPYTRRLTKESGRIDWTKSPEEVERFIRSVTPWPGAISSVTWQTANGKQQTAELKILSAHLEPKTYNLVTDLIQLPGKNPITWKQFLAGHPDATLK